jgi:hypothetical protein
MDDYKDNIDGKISDERFAKIHPRILITFFLPLALLVVL